MYCSALEGGQILTNYVLILLQVVFSVDDPAKSVHIELAVGPYGYSTHADIGSDD